MVFSSAVFIFIFLPVVFGVNLLAGKRLSNYWLLLASLFFYAWGEPVLIILMIFSIIFNWACGLLINQHETHKKALLLMSVIINLGLLIYFKYVGFLVDIINNICQKNVIETPEVRLPIGISFFTFQALSYVIDIYKGNTKPAHKLVDTALYIAFFPQLIAGPIVKYKEISKQIESRTITADGVAWGVRRFIYGLSKKVLIANVLGECVDRIHAYDIQLIDTKMAWICALLYTFQIYYDFSGYSDMAIGMGQMFGFSIPENFRYPYLSNSISEFWRRWHISLGAWFREYVYIPLGGSKKGKKKTYINLMIVFLLTGIWHGANYTFILWGLMNGFFVVIERIAIGAYLKKHRIISFLYCFFAVNIGWVMFRADSVIQGIQYMVRMVMPWRHPGTNVLMWEYLDKKVVIVFVCAIIGCGIIQKALPDRVKKKLKGSCLEAIYCLVLMVISMGMIAGDTYNPFIYFQF
ncbi:MAG: MBOAT family protein [Lachnospiraceae bacterium]|nr:MBOAT family protein [Lachnospiraceae bacterium]